MKIGKLGLLIVLGLVLMMRCNKNDDENAQSEISGAYIGIFERNGNTSNIELNFMNGIYSGESEIEKFHFRQNRFHS